MQRVTGKPNSVWNEEMGKLIEEYELYRTEFPTNKDLLNQHIDKKNTENATDRMNEERTQKMKIENWMTRKDTTKPGERPEYLNRLRRKQCSAIARIRSSIMVTKTNMPGKFSDKNC